MAFPKIIKDRILVECARHCCICHRFRGIHIELHHIKLQSEGGDDSFENCIPLCFDCHADMRSYDSLHPKGTKYSREELLLHRQSWLSKVASQKIKNPPSSYPIHEEMDKELLKKIKSILRWDIEIEAAKSRRFSRGPFNISIMRGFEIFTEEAYNNPSFEFLNLELESLLGELKKTTRDLCETIGYKVYPTKLGDNIVSIPSEWQYKQESRYMEAVKEIDSLTDPIVLAYDDLIKIGRRKLGD